ncbi:MAG: hypothetical protein C4527_16980 [Candidatus Omnitrophota bacterium]|jgi:16S rRNA (guanine(1405)-N(7))-methyltransferase|nr:MAG: hypothetical protein C4527_16980 [Candidatus Omnitrophota bacterium]
MKPDAHENLVESFVREVKNSRKYRFICEDTIRDVITTALPKYKKSRDAIKTARTKLHRIQAAYLGKNRIGDHLDSIQAAYQANDIGALKTVCLRLMETHSSTKERIPIIDHFYKEIFAITGVPQTVLDVACGIHPIAIPWMSLPRNVVFYAYEITQDLVDDLNRFMQAIGLEPHVKYQDVLCSPPQECGDLAFLMKMVPCLERRQKGLAIQLIENLRVRNVVVTFPVSSLAGRSKNMPQFYTESFLRMVDDHEWEIRKVPIVGELVFVVKKQKDED